MRVGSRVNRSNATVERGGARRGSASRATLDGEERGGGRGGGIIHVDLSITLNACVVTGTTATGGGRRGGAMIASESTEARERPSPHNRTAQALRTRF